MSTPDPTTTNWVPIWSLSGGVNQAYLGAWAAGTYQPGQIVVDNGIEYLCVRQTTKRPTPWAMSQAATYGTTLPASPIDGQEAVLVDSLTNPSYQWRFRYNANSTSAYKWEFVGGSPQVSASLNLSDTLATGWVVQSNPPAIGFPRNGEYHVSHSAMFYQGGAAATQVGLGTGIVGSLAGDQAHAIIGGTYTYTQLAIVEHMMAFTTAQYIQQITYSSAAGVTINQRIMTVQPKRVS